MNKTKRDIIIATVLVLIFIYTFTTNVLMGKRRHVEAPLPDAQEETLAVDTGVRNLVFITNLRVNDVILGKQEAFWEGQFGRDPFMAAAADRGDISTLVLKGIFWDEENPKALVNDKMISKGDNVMGYQVVEVRLKSVIFWNGEKNVELSLFGPLGVGDTPQ